MLVRHLMLEVNKGWHFRDALIILLLNTTLARLQTFMTLDLSQNFFFKQVSYASSAVGATANALKCTCYAFRATCLKYNSRFRQLVGFFFFFNCVQLGELVPNIHSEVDEMGKTFRQIIWGKKQRGSCNFIIIKSKNVCAGS